MAESEDLRRRIDVALEEVVTDELLRAHIAASFEAKKGARGWCPGCGKAVQVEINDVKATVAALETLANQAKGRPDVAAREEADRIVFKRLVKLEEES